MKKTEKRCWECGKSLQASSYTADGVERPNRPKKPKTKFCAAACKAAWNNRNKLRGFDLYNMFMANRYARKDKAVRGENKLGIKFMTAMCRLAERWHDEDTAAGRRPFADPTETMLRLMDSGKVRRGQSYTI